MRATRSSLTPPRRYLPPLITAAAVIIAPTVAHAEPGAPSGHWPLLWLGAIICAALVGSIPFWVERRSKKRRPKWKIWLAGILLALAFLVFVAPVTMALLSIMITGRTM